MKMRTEPLAVAVMAGAILCARACGAAAPPGGSIAIEPVTIEAGAARAVPAFVDAAGESLAANGFTILEDSGHAAYVAELTLRRTEVGSGTARVPAGRGSVAPGAYGGVGAGVTIPLATGNETIVPLERTEFELRIRKRGEPAVLWHGAAVTVRATGTRKGADEAVAGDLARAIFRGYPIEPEGVVGVP